VALLIAFAIFGSLFIDRNAVRQTIASFIAYVDGLGTLGLILLITVHAAAVAVCFPATVLFELGEGLVFGLFGGMLTVVVAKAVGASAAFLLGRTVLHDWVRAKLSTNDKFNNMYHNVGRDSFRVAFLLRLSPIPSWANNYGLACMTPIGFVPFIVATLVGTLPMIAQNVYFGSLLKNAACLGGADCPSTPAGGSNVLSWIYMVLGLAAMVVISRLLLRYANSQTHSLVTAKEPIVKETIRLNKGDRAVKLSSSNNSNGNGSNNNNNNNNNNSGINNYLYHDTKQGS